MGLVKGLHHVSMKCAGKEEYEKTLHFYRDIIGLAQIRSWDAGTMLDTGNGIVEIFSDGQEQLEKGTIRHFAFAAEDVDACAQAVRDAGYEVFVEPKNIALPALAARIAFCRGPLGEEIEFFQERFHFRSIRPDEVEQAVAIEQECFPPHEACSPKAMRERIAAAPELFLAAVDQATGKLAGFLNGVATSEAAFRDEFFTDAALHDPDGKNVMLLGLDVLPAYRGQGLAREIVRQYAARERANGRSTLILTCLDNKVKMYEKFGFADRGIANSSWGNEEWHEMAYAIA